MPCVLICQFYFGINGSVEDKSRLLLEVQVEKCEPLHEKTNNLGF